MTAAKRTWSTFGAIAITAGLLVGCTAAGSDSSDAEGNGSGDASGGNSLTCNWDSPAVTAEAAVDPAVQEGELSEILVGDWQRTGFDIGAGYQLYSSDGTTSDKDYRFVFDANGQFLSCEDTPKTDRGESRGEFTLEETKLDLGDDGAYTVLTWNADNMMLRNDWSGATVYLQRR